MFTVSVSVFQCNNPLTKEPKLKAALRILPEWKEYDYEVKVLWDKVYNTKTRHQVEYEPPSIGKKKIGEVFSKFLTIENINLKSDFELKFLSGLFELYSACSVQSFRRTS